jgi:hypothetical protein
MIELYLCFHQSLPQDSPFFGIFPNASVIYAFDTA